MSRENALSVLHECRSDVLQAMHALGGSGEETLTFRALNCVLFIQQMAIDSINREMLNPERDYPVVSSDNLQHAIDDFIKHANQVADPNGLLGDLFTD